MSAFRDEAAAQADRWFLGAPVAAGCGAAAYLGLPAEPHLPAVLAVSLLLAAAALASARWGRNRGLLILSALLAFAAAGFAVCALRGATAALKAPASRGPVTVEGWVVDVASASAERPRLLIAPSRIEGVPPEATPRRLRITLRQGGVWGPGSAIRVRAILNPPPPPASPGAYDFARDAHFQRIGGSGLALGRPAVASLPRAPLDLRLQMTVNAARWSLARRLVGRIGPEVGGFAAALVTGHEAWLPGTDIQAMRDSGLAHILSISGMHMAIVGGFVFAAARLGVAAWPWLALRAPGKKIAAGAGLVAIGAYLVVSGAPPPAERAAITAGVAFTAMLLGRRAFTLNSLAVAALVVLAIQPAAVAQPGFQMSFAATAALLALVEIWPRVPREINAPWPIRAVQGLRTWGTAAFLISLVAGSATAPFAIQHFNRVPVWGLPANLATEALSSLVVLPFLAAGAVLELVGLGAAPLALAGWGLESMRSLAHTFAGLPSAVLVVASAPQWALPTSFLGLLFVCIWRGRLRWLGLPVAAAVSLAPRPSAPDLWIADGGANAAIRIGKEAVVARPDAQQFASDLWMRRRGLFPAADPEVASEAYFECGRDSCLSRPEAPVKLALWRRRIPPGPAAQARLCQAEVVVVRTGGVDPALCEGAVVLDEPALRRGGAVELHRTSEGWRAVWAQDLRGNRPWTTTASADGADQ